MFRETLLAAVAAGLIAALAFTVLQSAFVTPLILQAEAYEPQQAAPVGHEHHDHHHDPHGAEWRPENGWQRLLFTFAANMLLGFGQALVLTSVYLLWRQPKSAVGGAVYGLAGFASFFFAPGLGLPPELPGTAAAELPLRQVWWLMIAVATGAGLLLVFSRVAWWRRALGVVLIVAPHFVSAPRPEAVAALAPAELRSQFQIATALSNAAFWLLLGVASSVAFRKLVAKDVRFHVGR